MKRSLLSALVSFSMSAPALAQNLLQDPGFTSSLAGWTPTGTTTSSFSAEDASGAAGSGSALIGGTAAGDVGGLKQCVFVLPGQAYSLVFRTRLVSGSAGDSTSGGYPFASYAFFSDASCTTPVPSAADQSVGVGPTPSWTTITVLASTVPASPATANSALVTVGVQNRSQGPFPVVGFDDVLFARYRPVTVTIPASASIHGQNNAFFQTDLWFVNSSPILSVPVSARHYCFAGQTCSGTDKSVVIAARGTTQYNDAIGGLFGDPSTAGAVAVTYDAALSRVSVLSRTYSPSLPAPTSGSALPALEAFEARGRSILPGLASNGGDLSGGFRTNVGFFNPTDSPTNVTVTLHGQDGQAIGSPVVRVVGAFEPLQVNDVFGAAGAGGTVTTNAYAVVISDIEGVFSYATIIDNKSTDSMIVTGEPDQTSIYP